MKSYEAQRRERLSDAIFDYIQDDNVDARELYRDIKNEVVSSMNYYKRYADKCNDLLDKLNGYREVDFSLEDLAPQDNQLMNKIQATSPYNDGWTKEFYNEIVKDTETNGISTASIGMGTSPDWQKFWNEDSILTDC